MSSHLTPPPPLPPFPGGLTCERFYTTPQKHQAKDQASNTGTVKDWPHLSHNKLPSETSWLRNRSNWASCWWGTGSILVSWSDWAVYVPAAWWGEGAGGRAVHSAISIWVLPSCQNCWENGSYNIEKWFFFFYTGWPYGVWLALEEVGWPCRFVDTSKKMEPGCLRRSFEISFQTLCFISFSHLIKGILCDHWTKLNFRVVHKETCMDETNVKASRWSFRVPIISKSSNNCI